MRVSGTLAFVDISGFTQLTERLARKGKVGAEEMSDTLNATFAALLDVAYDDGADLVKWGGDAVLLLFQGPDHALRAARAAHRMRATHAARSAGSPTVVGRRDAADVGRASTAATSTSSWSATPRSTASCSSAGPAATPPPTWRRPRHAGEIGLSAATAALLAPRCSGPALRGGRLLRSAPVLDDVVGMPPPRTSTGVDPAAVLPPPIREHLLAGAGEPEHRADHRGVRAVLRHRRSCSRPEGPAALADALDEVVRNVQHACADARRHVLRDRHQPRRRQDHAHRRRAAQRGPRRGADAARRPAGRSTVPARCRSGSASTAGAVFAGDFGPAFRRTYSVKGDAINLAARVMGKAAPGAGAGHRARSWPGRRPSSGPPSCRRSWSRARPQPVRAARASAPCVGARDERPARRPARRARRGDGGPAARRWPSVAARPRPARRARRRAGHRQVAAGRRAADAASTTSPSCVGAVRGVRVVHGRTSRSAGCCATCWACPPTRDAEHVAAAAASTGSRGTPRTCVPWLPLLGIPLDVALPPTPETHELDEQFRKAPARGGRRPSCSAGCCRRPRCWSSRTPT